MKMRDEEIASYLKDNPQFFEDHAEMLSGVTLPHPHGGRTISLSERQLLTLREKNKELEKRLHELLEFAKENDGLQHKVHQFACALYSAHDLSAMQDAILDQMRGHFNVPHVALHLWAQDPASSEVLTFADQMTHPACTHRAMYDTGLWFGEIAHHLRSFAYLPLREGNGEAVGYHAASSLRGLREGGGESGTQTIGLLVLASEEPQRFYPEMGTLFLQRIAEIVSSALRSRQ
jgi:uncharacterized protein